MTQKAYPFFFREGDRVAKRGGDYSFVGVVLAAFSKRSGSPRYAVENDDGLIHIFNGEQLVRVPDRAVCSERSRGPLGLD
jgi:hypothetical protein